MIKEKERERNIKNLLVNKSLRKKKKIEKKNLRQLSARKINGSNVDRYTKLKMRWKL